ncbi:hypothetical protein Tsubulata_004858 [Turnera subulata]|uniref:Fe2OG dioxygenase domain-containing protein n=1 Tax=Turnera subulata TaxID=218843 RepID=A0A9Q0GJ60_9ROSI|nr:hypothetical protein Tsubulata_004858 [Turnera subulata]
MESSSLEVETVKLGKSIIVPSVQELAKESITNIPPRYVRLDQDPRNISTFPDNVPLLSVPIIDLQRLDVEGDSKDSVELERLHSACKDWGFFQVLNHGVSSALLEEFRLEVENLFKLPFSEKKKLWQQPDNHEGFGQLFVVSEEQKLDWSDMFGITILPLSVRNNNLLAKLPPKLREILKLYSTEVKKLAMTILGHMAQALKMDRQEMEELFSEGLQAIRMNYYPPCPEPDKAIGFTPHSDADALTILFQLNETEGLQIRKQGRWIPVKPLPDAFVVNIGDIMEIVSNGTYRSIEHRAIVNSSKERISVATFYTSKLESVIGPASSIIGAGIPAIFRRVLTEKYLKDYFARRLEGKSYLDFMKIVDGQDIMNK